MILFWHECIFAPPQEKSFVIYSRPPIYYREDILEGPGYRCSKKVLEKYLDEEDAREAAAASRVEKKLLPLLLVASFRLFPYGRFSLDVIFNCVLCVFFLFRD